MSSARCVLAVKPFCVLIAWLEYWLEWSFTSSWWPGGKQWGSLNTFGLCLCLLGMGTRSLGMATASTNFSHKIEDTKRAEHRLDAAHRPRRLAWRLRAVEQDVANKLKGAGSSFDRRRPSPPRRNSRSGRLAAPPCRRRRLPPRPRAIRTHVVACLLYMSPSFSDIAGGVCIARGGARSTPAWAAPAASAILAVSRQ